MTTEHHLQLEIDRLTSRLDEMTRRWESTQDVVRMAETLYFVIREKASYTTGGIFGASVDNLGQALRNLHDMDGAGR